MLDSGSLRDLVKSILVDRLPGVGLQQILTEQAIDSEGKDSLRITLVIPEEAVDTITGEQALDLITDVHKALAANGDDRLAVIGYATPADLADEAAQEEGTQQDEDDV